MGVRLVRYTRHNNEISSYNDHDELINRDLMNQHPIYAITGLQEVLNILEDSIYDTNDLILQKETIINGKIDAIMTDIADINQALLDIGVIIADLNVIDNVEETYSIKMEYDETTNTLKGDVKVYPDKNDSNALQILADGLYVPKVITEETSSIKWTEETIGESLSEIYENGIKFSHGGTWNNVYSSDEAKAWYWDDAKQSFVQPKNTSTFTGFITQNLYDYYTHIAQCCSTDSDNDVNGLIIGFVFDENGNPNTLSVVVNKQDGVANSYKIIYNYKLPNQEVITTIGDGTNGVRPGNYSTSGWNGISNGITIRVTKHKNIITTACSDWNSTTINENTNVTINLDDYSWGHLFRGIVHYGYCNYSQAYSYFQNISFVSENIASTNKLLAVLKLSEDENNAAIIKEDGLFVPGMAASPDEGNALSKRENGYYVEGMTISSKENNALSRLTDGLYVREHSNVKLVTQENHEFSIGDFIYYHPTSGYKLALADDSYSSNIVGMVTNVINDNTFEYQWSGFYKTDIFSSDKEIIQGIPLYISDKNPGKVVQEQPDISKAVGYPIENIGIIISIERGIQYNMEATIGDFKTSANTYNVRSDGFIRIVDNIEYKQSLVEKLLDSLDEDFKEHYLIFNDTNNTVSFVNSDTLYIMNNVSPGLNLFIKAF